ncbi:MAG: sulfotransferase [Planctomycetaceae bacterium]|nr:sulfotransferase [Planctomycetaceae bacterium]
MSIESPEKLPRMVESKPKSTSQGPLSMWHCTDVPRLLKLLSMRPSVHWSRWHRWCMLPPCAVYNSVMGLGEKLVFGRKIAETQIHPSPIFIIGHWRSGTTLLHNLISLDRQFTFPTMYHTAFPQHFLLTERIVSRLSAPLVPKSRPMDNVEAGWGMPQEDEIALCALCLISPYLMITFPERSAYSDYFDFKTASPEDVAMWKQTFLNFLRKVTYREPKPIVLKSPSHTYRVRLMLEMFPEAKFVYIHRHPYDVFRSSMHLRDTLFEANSLGLVDREPWEEEVLHDYRWAVDCYERDRQLIPEGNLYEVRFEDLEADPLRELERMYSGLSLPAFDAAKQALIPEVERLKGYKKNSFRRMDLRTKRLVYSWMRPMFERYGYDSEGAERESDSQQLAVPA